MKIVRFLDRQGNTQYGCLHGEQSTTRLEGSIYGDFHDTGQPVTMEKLLAPIAPVDIICIGLNYARHAEEGNLPLPEYPVVFAKSTGVVQNPGDPIVLPRHLRSDEVDYEIDKIGLLTNPVLEEIV